MIKKILILLSASSVLLSGCAKTVRVGENTPVPPATEAEADDLEETPQTEKTAIKIGATKGAGSVSIAHLLENSEDDSAYETYSAELYQDPNQLMGALAKGDVNAAILPPDKAAKLYNEYDFKCCVGAISSTCNYYILENGGSQSYSDIKDFDGRTIIINETDKMAEPVLNKIAEYKGISFEYRYVDTNEAVIKALSETPGSLALLQEPFCSQAELTSSGIFVVADLYDYWQEAADCTLATNCLVISKKFLDSNREVSDLFIKDYVASVSITRHNMSKTAELAEKYELFDSKDAVEKAIPGCGIGILTGPDMKVELNKLYTILYDISIDSVGRAVPDDAFYYMQ